LGQTVVVTGAGGFIGLALTERLLRAGAEVRAAVRRDSAALGGLAGLGRLYQVVVGDIGAATDWSDALAGADAVVHLAARVHVMRPSRRDDRERYAEINRDATLRLAEAAGRAGVKRLVFVSSAKAEDGSGDPYSRSKAEAERLLRDASGDLGLECVIVRPPLVYGPGVRANFLRLMRLVDSGVPLPFGDIDNRRSFVFVGNLADALHACIDHPRAAGQTFAVSDGEDVSTPELVRRIARALDRPARLFPIPLRLLALAGRLTGQAQAVGRLTGSLTVDASAIRTTLGWRPPFSMQQGLARTAAWYRGREVGGDRGHLDPRG